MQFPDGFKEKYTKLLQDEAPAFFASFDQPAYSGYRVNPLRNEAPLAVSGKAIAWSRYGHYGKVNGNQIDHVSGYVYSQEPSAQFVAEVLAPRPGEIVLDLCAAPGGKTTHIASFMDQKGVLVTNEIDRSRANVLASNVERFGIQNAIVTNNDPDTLAKAWPGVFDRILVDAPCSGEGMFRKDPDAKQYWDLDYPAKCARRQKTILPAAVKMLKPGGILVYSTCTFAPEEDEQMAAWAHTELGINLLPIKKTGGIEAGQPKWADGQVQLSDTARLWPHKLEGEGHFVAKFQKPNGDSPKVKPAAQTRLTPALMKELQAFEAANLTATFSGNLTVNKDQLFLLPASTPSLRGVRVVRPGLHLGTFKKNRFEPSHSLATALKPDQFKQVIAISEEEFARYRHGETLPSTVPGKAWVLLTCAGKGFAIGKLVNGTIKNAYPKGLRV